MLNFIKKRKIEKRLLKEFKDEVDTFGLYKFYKSYKNDFLPNYDVKQSVSIKDSKNNVRRDVKRLRKILEDNNVDEIDKKLTLSVLESYYIEHNWLLNDSLDLIPYNDEESLFKQFEDLVDRYYKDFDLMINRRVIS